MSIEKQFAQELRRTKLRTAILSTIEFSGVLALAVMAPNVVQLLGKRYGRSSLTSVKSATARLIEKGYLIKRERGLELTAKGAAYLSRDLKIAKPRRWDRRWRLVIFDIPEKRRLQRNKLRDMLMHLGFVRVQSSVWTYPYDCEDLIVLLRAEYHLGKEVLYMIVDKMERDTPLRRHFGLQQ